MPQHLSKDRNFHLGRPLSLGWACIDRSLRVIAIDDALSNALELTPFDSMADNALDTVLPDLAPAWEPVLRQAITTAAAILDVPFAFNAVGRRSCCTRWSASFFPVLTCRNVVTGVEIEVQAHTGANGETPIHVPHTPAAFVQPRRERPKPGGDFSVQPDVLNPDLAQAIHFRNVLDVSTDGFMLLESVRNAAGTIVDFRWRYANPAAEQIVGRPPEWFVGKLLLEEMPGNHSDGLFDAYVRVVETEEPWTAEFTYAHEGVDVYIRLVAVKADDGFAVTFTDLSERRMAELRLRESESRFRTLADNISQLAWMADANGWIFWYNRRWYDYTGTNLEEMQGWGWMAVHHPDHIDRVVSRLQHSWDTGEPWEDTFPLRGRDGEYRWFLSRALPIRDEHGHTIRWFGTNTDVTEQRTIEEALRGAMAREQQLRGQAEEANRLKDAFLSIVSHELRTPLTALLGYAQLLQIKKRDEAYIARTVERIIQSAKAQSQLVDDLLDVSRIMSGKIRMVLQPLDVATVIHAACDTVLPTVEARGLDMQLDLEPDVGPVMGDKGRLQQVVWNLLMNAAKFTPSGGMIAVTLTAHHHDAVITVCDNGQGIQPEFLPYVFERFRQSDRAGQRIHSGLGLGLSIVRDLVELHGGRVEAMSEGLGMGATFIVRLPLSTEGDTPDNAYA